MKYCSRKFLDFSTIVPKKEPLYMGGRDNGEKRKKFTNSCHRVSEYEKEKKRKKRIIISNM